MKSPFNARRNFVLPAIGLLLGALLAQAADVANQQARTAPAWLRAGVIYEIFPRNFSPAGDFNGITAQLDRLNDLGVTVLWLMPVFPIGEKLHKGGIGSPYAIRDYYAINPDYGTANDLKRLVNEAHQRGMKVILDIALNHTAWDNVLISSHPEFYKQDAAGKIIPPVPEWADVAGLNYQNPKLREYMIAMMKYWVQEFGVDGFRCDAAAYMPTDFWEQARVELEKTRPDIGLLAEADKPELLVKAFDIDYSWPLRSTLDDVLVKGAPASNLRATWEENLRWFPKGALHMRISDDHDEARAVAKYGIRGALAAQALMFTLDGVPLLYNGMEAGDATESGDPALFEKLPIFWSPKERPPLRDIYRDLIKLRKQYPAFRRSGVNWLHNSDEADLVSFMRQDASDQFVIVINFSNRPLTGKVEVENCSEFKPVEISGISKPPGDDFPLCHLGAFEWRIYYRAVPR
jgi:glycosidase